MMSLSVATVFGIIGSIVSPMAYLAPLPIFRRIVRNGSTEGFQSITYSVVLFSSTLLLYYGCLKTNGLFIIINNSIGSVIESIYLIVYLIYATRTSRLCTIPLVVLFNFVAYGVIVACTHVLLDGDTRIVVVGWICAVLPVFVFAAPLGIMVRVIRTKSVEFMPIILIALLTVSAVTWLVYGLLIKDYYIAGPNVLGILFGIVQIIVYLVYR